MTVSCKSSAALNETACVPSRRQAMELLAGSLRHSCASDAASHSSVDYSDRPRQ